MSGRSVMFVSITVPELPTKATTRAAGAMESAISTSRLPSSPGVMVTLAGTV